MPLTIVRPVCPVLTMVAPVLEREQVGELGLLLRPGAMMCQDVSFQVLLLGKLLITHIMGTLQRRYMSTLMLTRYGDQLLSAAAQRTKGGRGST